jgi:anti-sigma28 factor (negative regulator of flagellin synthesis)
MDSAPKQPPQDFDITRLSAGKKTNTNNAYSIPELKAILKHMELSPTGTKEELVERIRQNLTPNAYTTTLNGTTIDLIRLSTAKSSATNNTYSIPELKAILKQMGLNCSGTKETMVERIRQQLLNTMTTTTTTPPQTKKQPPKDFDITRLTGARASSENKAYNMTELRAFLKELELSGAGSKEELVERIKQNIIV